MIPLEIVKKRFAEHYIFTHGTLGTRVNNWIDVYNGYIPGELAAPYSRAFDPRTGLSGVVDTEAKPMQFIPTLAMNQARVNYLLEYILLPVEFAPGFISAITLDALTKAPGFDSKQLEILKQYQETGYEYIVYTVVYKEPSYGIHLVLKGI